MRRLSLLLVLVALAASGCDSGSDAIGITGDWEGELVGTGGAYPVAVTFRDSGQRVTGAGRVDLSDGPFAFDVTNGTFIDGVATLDLRFEGFPPTGQITATLVQTNPGVLSGTFQGRGEANGSLRIELVDR